jgi:dihydrofolate synthase / folylpolyglutamate synthase
MSATLDIIDRLSARWPKGFDLTLGRIERLLGALGNPHLRLPPVIHVAGTNGKGSTIAFLRAMIEASGLAVHTHTSPHLVSYNERYRIAAGPGRSAFVTDEAFATALSRRSPWITRPILATPSSRSPSRRRASSSPGVRP